jgi:hypothetical protein
LLEHGGPFSSAVNNKFITMPSALSGNHRVDEHHSNVVIVTEVHPDIFSSQEEKRSLESWITKEFGPLSTGPSWLSSFRRLILVFEQIVDAKRAKSGIDYAIWHGTPVRAFMGDASRSLSV